MTFRHRAGVTPYTSSYEFAECCVFSKQSLPPGHCNPSQLGEQVSSPAVAHLLPKLRCQFAEFLNQGSLKRLGILSPPTCVGLRYGHQRNSLRGFSWKHGITGFVRLGLSTSPLSVWNGGADLPTPPAYRLEPGRPSTRPDYPSPSPLRSNVTSVVRELLTRFPSPTPFGLGLGAD